MLRVFDRHEDFIKIVTELISDESIGVRSCCFNLLVVLVAASVYGGEGAYLWLDGREVSPPGAALANGMTIDSLDIHDGHPLTKGHAGAAIVPALFASAPIKKSAKRISGREFMTTLIIGYETALRPA